MHVPLLDLNAQYVLIKDEIRFAVNEILEAQSFILGKPVTQLEEEIAAYSQAKFGIGVASGSDALYLSLKALGVTSGDEVITTPYTFFATAGAITQVGAIPVFVDIDPTTYNINPKLIKAAITPRTKAIIPVHLYGQCADMSAIMEIAKAENLAVVEDAAQAIGAEYQGHRAGSLGDFGCFSFFPSKNLGGIGDGGMVTTNQENLAQKIRLLRVHGSANRYEHQIVGVNSRLDAIQAAVLLVKFKHLPRWSQQRRANADCYRKLFTEAGLLEKVGLPVEASGNVHIYNQFVIRVKERDAVRKSLEEAGVSTAIYYPLPLHLQECYRSLGYQNGDFPESEKAAKETIALPIYPELTPQMLEYVVDRIKCFYA